MIFWILVLFSFFLLFIVFIQTPLLFSSLLDFTTAFYSGLITLH